MQEAPRPFTESYPQALSVRSWASFALFPKPSMFVLMPNPMPYKGVKREAITRPPPTLGSPRSVRLSRT